MIRACCGAVPSSPQELYCQVRWSTRGGGGTVDTLFLKQRQSAFPLRSPYRLRFIHTTWFSDCFFFSSLSSPKSRRGLVVKCEHLDDALWEVRTQYDRGVVVSSSQWEQRRARPTSSLNIAAFETTSVTCGEHRATFVEMDEFLGVLETRQSTYLCLCCCERSASLSVSATPADGEWRSVNTLNRCWTVLWREHPTASGRLCCVIFLKVWCMIMTLVAFFPPDRVKWWVWNALVRSFYTGMKKHKGKWKPFSFLRVLRYPTFLFFAGSVTMKTQRLPGC